MSIEPSKLSPQEQQAVLYALRTFIREHDGKPMIPTGPAQSDVNLAKSALEKLY